MFDIARASGWLAARDDRREWCVRRELTDQTGDRIDVTGIAGVAAGQSIHLFETVDRPTGAVDPESCRRKASNHLPADASTGTDHQHVSLRLRAVFQDSVRG